MQPVLGGPVAFDHTPSLRPRVAEKSVPNGRVVNADVTYNNSNSVSDGGGFFDVDVAQTVNVTAAALS